MSACVDCQAAMNGLEAQSFLQCRDCRRLAFRSRRRLLPRIPTFDEYIERENCRRRSAGDWGRKRTSPAPNHA